MNRLLNVIILFFITISCLSAQGVGIGTTTPDASALLDLSSTTKGVLLPRMTAAQRSAIVAPATGLQVYQTDGAKGFYYFDGATWTLMNGGGGTSGWSMTGNANINPAINFIGTTDAQPFIAKVNNEQVFRFAPNSNNTVIGYQANHSDYTGGTYNHVIGYKAGYNNAGSFGHFDGLQAGYNNTGNNNQFIGYNTGYTNTTGYSNLFIGSAAGYSNTSGFQNNFLGYQAGYSNTSGGGNQFSGFQTGFKNTVGGNNQFSGYQAGYNNTNGNYNFFDGFNAGKSNVAGNNNYYSGYQAGYNSTSDNNHFIGFKAGYNNTTGYYNQFEGLLAGFSNTTGYENQFIGYAAGYANTTGNLNHFNGWEAGYNNTTGSFNHFEGWQAGYYNTTGSYNYFSGYQCGAHNTTGKYNIAIGNQSQFNHSTGDYNTMIGWQAGFNNINGHNNVFIGTQAGFMETGSDKLYIAGNFNDHPLIWGDFYNEILKIHGAAKVLNTSYTNEPAFEIDEQYDNFTILRFRNENAPPLWWDMACHLDGQQQGLTILQFNANGQSCQEFDGLGNMVTYGSIFELSDSTLKENIEPIQDALSIVQHIKGVTYHWKDAKRSRGEQIGFLAQDIERNFPQLIHTNEKGEKAVSYTHMVPVLLEAIKEQQAEIDELKARQSDMEEMKVKMDLMEAQLAELLKSK